jgi:hypothetical protein
MSPAKKSKASVVKTSPKTATKKVTASKSKATRKSTTPVVTAPVMPVMSGKPAMTAAKVEPKKLFWPLLFVALALGFYLIKDELIVATVNGRPITRVAVIRELERQGASQVVEDIVLRTLVEQELKKAGIEIDQAAVEEEIVAIEEQLSAQGQSLDDLLAAQSLTREEVKQQIGLSKGMEQLLADGLTVSEEEIEAYFNENKEMMGEGADLETMRADIRDMLFQQQLGQKQQTWINDLKKDAKINYFKFKPSLNL